VTTRSRADEHSAHAPGDWRGPGSVRSVFQGGTRRPGEFGWDHLQPARRDVELHLRDTDDTEVVSPSRTVEIA
jgi:hypothetical protein